VSYSMLYSSGISKTAAVIIAIIVVIAVIAGIYVAITSVPKPPASPSPTTSPTTSTPTTTSPVTSPSPSLTPTKPKEKTVIIYASLSEMTTADPSTEFSNSVIWLPLVYEPLLWYDPLEDKFIPALAESWEVKENGKVWIFHIREDAKFHDGTPVTAEAVAASINRTITLGQGAAYIWEPVKKIEVVDKYTVKFILKYPAPLNKIASSCYAAYIFSPKVVEYAGAKNLTDPKVAEWFNAGQDAGSGPYRLVKWDPENEVILEKWPEWWGWKLPDYPMKSDKAPDVFIIKIVKDAVTQERLVLSGDIHIAEYVPLDDVEMLKKDPRVHVVMKPSFQNLLLLFNTKKPPLDNPLVRKAIAHAIPYDEIVKVARAGIGRVASGPIPHGMWGHFDNLTYKYDLELAKKLLAEAGYPNGIPRTLILTYTAGDIYEKRTAELIKASLAKIGIKVEIRPMSWEEQWALAQSGWENPEAAQDLFIFYWWPDVVSPITYLYNMFHSESKAFNLCYYEDSEFDKIIMEAYKLEGTNKKKALELYYKAQKMLYDDVPAVALWDMVDVRVAVKGISNLDKAINPAYPTTIFAQVLSVEG